MSFTEYLTQFLAQAWQDRALPGPLSHLDVLAALVAAAEMVATDRRVGLPRCPEMYLTQNHINTIINALLNQPDSYLERNHPGRLEYPHLPA